MIREWSRTLELIWTAWFLALATTELAERLLTVPRSASAVAAKHILVASRATLLQESTALLRVLLFPHPLKRLQMPGRTIAVGDIHGCAAALEAILDVVQPAADDTLITLGDYIDRGPNSRRVIEVLLQVARCCRLVPLKGNHELLMLRAMDVPGNMIFWMQSGGLATLASYGGVSEIPPEHVDFVRSCVDYYETETHLFVHASYDPELPLDETAEYELFWQHLNMVLPAPHISGKTAIVGHTPQRSGDVLEGGHLLCIDTYCFGSGWLTALDVASGQLWQADKQGKLRA